MQVLGFYLVDLIVLGVILLSGIFALARGLVREVLAIFSWVGAAFATFYGFEIVDPYTQRLIESPMIANIVTGAGIFLIVLFVLSLIAGAISGAVRGTAAGSVDRTLGFVFGLARGAVLVCIVYLGLSFMIPPKEQPPWLQEARSAPLMAKGADFLYSLAPAHIRNNGARPRFERNADGARPGAMPAQSSANPAPAAAPAPNADKSGGTGYQTDQRREMDRLIEGMQ